MKKLIAVFCILVLVVCSACALADGEYQSVYNDNYRWSGIVICTNLSIRESPSTSAKRYGQLHNGDVVIILDEKDGWYHIDLASTGLPNVPDGVGYAK